jgi:hypothetical protein
MCLAPVPVVLVRFRVTRANLPPLALPIHPSSILANPPRSPTRTNRTLTVRGVKKLDK